MVYVIKVKYGDTLRRFTFESQPRREDMSFPILESKIRGLFDLPTERQIRVTYTDRDDDVITMADDQDLVDALILQSLNPLRLHVSEKETMSTALVVIPAVPTSESGVAKDSLDSPMNQTLKELIARSIKQGDEALLGGPASSPRQMVELLVDNLIEMVKILEMKKPYAKVSSGLPEAMKIGSAATSAGFPLPRPTEASASTVKSDSNEAAELKTVNRVFHDGVQCDVCGMCPIVGTRFKSTKKHDYDLCSNCIKEAEDQADYTRINRQLFRPRHPHPAGSGRMRCPALDSNHYPERHGSMSGPYSSRSTGCYFQRPAHPMNGAMYAGKLDSRFVDDVTIMDGTEMAPGTRFTKIWRLRNSGKVPWAPLTTLVHVGGDELGSVFIVPLQLPEKGLLPEQEVEAAVDLVAPEKPGRYVSHWRLASPAGAKFGHRVWVAIQVALKDSSTTAGEETVGLCDAKSHEDEVTEETLHPAAVVNESREDFVKASHEAIEQPKPKVTYPQIDVTSSFVDIIEPFSGLKVLETEGEMEIPKENDAVAQMMEELPTENMVQVQEEVAALENSELGGGFSMVEMPSSVSDEAKSTPTTPKKEAEVAACSKQDEQEVDGEENTENTELEENTPEELSAKLEAMGFSDRILNTELLVKNKCDLRRTLDDLFAAAEWDPILEELEEMGFYDVQMNRRLMFKNKGSVKHVVKELVQLYKEPESKGTARARPF